MSYYWVGDKPVTALVLVPTRHGESFAGNEFTGISGVLVKPNGVTRLVDSSLSIENDEEGLSIKVQFEGDSWFTMPGLYQLRMTLKGAGGGQERLDAIQLVVHADDGWHTIPSARSEWTDAPMIDERLWPLLELAKQQVLAYAPDLEDDSRPPINYRYAQLQHARNIFNAGRVDPSTGDSGGDGFALTPFPIDWAIKQMLRPKNPRPVAL